MQLSNSTDLCMQFAQFGIVNFIYFDNFEQFLNLTNHNFGHIWLSIAAQIIKK